jgi:hypothetical protein
MCEVWYTTIILQNQCHPINFAAIVRGGGGEGLSARAKRQSFLLYKIHKAPLHSSGLDCGKRKRTTVAVHCVAFGCSSLCCCCFTHL